MDNQTMSDTQRNIHQASVAQLLELLWQIWDILNRRLRFADGPFRCRHQCQWCEHRCCYHSHTISQEQRHEWYGPHKCFLHDENAYDYL